MPAAGAVTMAGQYSHSKNISFKGASDRSNPSSPPRRSYKLAWLMILPLLPKLRRSIIHSMAQASAGTHEIGQLLQETTNHDPPYVQ